MTPTPDSLLPPAAAQAATTSERVPLPASIPTRSPRQAILIPTEHGLVGVHEPVKTIVRGDEEIELRRLTPEEKARRRLIRNAIFIGFCLLTLIVVMLMLSWPQ
jgi:hypothetical protein